MGDQPVNEEKTKVRILLAHEHSLFRQAVRAILSGYDDLIVVAEAGEGFQAVREAERTRPDLALVQATIPGVDGIRTTSLIREAVPACNVLVLSENEDTQLLLAALDAGASGLVTLGLSLDGLVDATRSVPRGEMFIPSGMVAPLVQGLMSRRRHQVAALRLLRRLTRKERKVLALVANGSDNEEVARALQISPETARTHVQNLSRKLEVHSRLQAAAFVTQNGLLRDLLDELLEDEEVAVSLELRGALEPA
jgi:DNA-binding NarL/FixJ family response regulator